MEGVTTAVVNKINEAALRLLNKGAYGIMILNLPDLSLIPYARNHGIVERLHKMTSLHNAKLGVAVKNLIERYPNQVIYYDINATFTDILRHPDEYNQKYNTHVTDTNHSCWSGTVWGMNTATSINFLSNDLKSAGLNPNKSGEIMTSPALRETYEVGMSYENGNMPCHNADEYMFWDDLHPTAVVHSVLGKIMINELESRHWM